MANISTFLQAIMSARYGKDVRQSIHDGIKAINDEVAADKNEVIASKEAAENAATAASTSAQEASASESAAKKSETAAAASESAVSTSAQEASASESAAKKSENAAAASESAAATSAQKASASESAAKKSENAAAASESAAATSAQKASASESAAKKSETAAAASKSVASTSAQTAIDKATLAKSYAVGGTGTRAGEDTDNAKYYMTQAEKQTGGIPTKLSKLENDAGFIAEDGDGSGLTVGFTEAAARENIASGENTGTLMGKIKKWLADLAAAAFMQVITSYADLMAGTALDNYLIGAAAAKEGFTELNGKLAVQDASARLNPINGSLTYSQLRKYGKVVTISFRLTDCDIPYGTVICTLPEGYIPSTTWISIFGQVYDGSSWISGSITIDLGGNIRQEITQNNTKMCIFSGAFITD